MMRTTNLKLCLLAGLLSHMLTNPSLAQFQKAPETIKVVMGTENKEAKTVLGDRGQALELPITFPFYGREKVSIEATIKQPGRFDVELISPKALFEVKDLKVEDGVGKADLVRKVEPMSGDDLRKQRDEALEELAGKQAIDKARKQSEEAKMDDVRRYLRGVDLDDDQDERARKLFMHLKAFEGKANLLRKKLDEAAEENPRRFTQQEKKSWDAMKFHELYVVYRKVLQTELAEKQLIRYGLEADRGTRNAAENVVPMVLALHYLMTGQNPDKESEKAVRDATTGGLMQVMRKALMVDLRLRIYSESDTTDPNSQWFNAQRVACRAIGVNTIRVEGTLDPGKGDSVDWWILERWDPLSIQMTTSSDDEVRFAKPEVDNGVARLQVIAGKKPAKYWFELKVDKGGDLKVVVHESMIPAEVKFPY